MFAVVLECHNATYHRAITQYGILTAATLAQSGWNRLLSTYLSIHVSGQSAKARVSRDASQELLFAILRTF
jgi:hypothetical protein